MKSTTRCVHHIFMHANGGVDRVDARGMRVGIELPVLRVRQYQALYTFWFLLFLLDGIFTKI